jgi:hypothetical protein
MPIVSATEPPVPCLVEIIDFKWLMAGAGHRVHVERLQADRAYAGQCLALGAASQTPALRDAAQRLATTLDLHLPDPRAAA